MVIHARMGTGRLGPASGMGSQGGWGTSEPIFRNNTGRWLGPTSGAGVVFCCSKKGRSDILNKTAWEPLHRQTSAATCFQLSQH